MTIDECMSLPYDMLIEIDEGKEGYVASYPALPGCVTCGSTIEEAARNAEDAKRAWLEAAIEDGISLPIPDNDEGFSGQLRLRMPKSLHRLIAAQSKREGVSMNQYIVYQLASVLGRVSAK